MLLGDPYRFAVLAEVIPAWNADGTFDNGVLLLAVDGQFFPQEIVTAPLRGELYWLREKLQHLSGEEALCQLPKAQAFAVIYARTYPEDSALENDYRFDLTPDSLADQGCFVFAVASGDKVRILAAALAYDASESRYELEQALVSEAFLSAGEIAEIAAGLLISEQTHEEGI